MAGRYTKILTDLMRKGGVYQATSYMIGGRRGLPVINMLRKVYPQLSIKDVGRLYQAALRLIEQTQVVVNTSKTRRPTLRSIPINTARPISSPKMNRVRYDVRVYYDRGSLRNRQVTTVYVDSPRPLTAAQLDDAVERAFWAQVGTLGGSPPFLPGESIKMIRYEVAGVWRNR